MTSLTVAHVTFDEDLKVRCGVRIGLTAETSRLLAFSLVPRALPWGWAGTRGRLIKERTEQPRETLGACNCVRHQPLSSGPRMPSQKSKIESPHPKDHFTVSHTQTLIDCGGTNSHDIHRSALDRWWWTISDHFTVSYTWTIVFWWKREITGGKKADHQKSQQETFSPQETNKRETLIAPPPLSSLAPRARTPSASYAADISSSNL